MLTREAMNRIPRKNRKIVLRLPECQLGEEKAEGQVQEGGTAVGDRGGDGEQPDRLAHPV